MTTPDPSLGEQSGPQSEVTQASAQQPTGDTPVSDLSEEQLLELITAETPEEVSGIVKPQEAPPASEQQPQTPREETNPDTPAKPPGRLSVRALPADQQVEMARALEMVRNKEAADVLEALQKVRGVQATPQAAANQDPDPDTEEKPPSQTQATPQETGEVQSIEARLADLRAQRKAAKSDFDTDLEETLTTEIEDTLIALQEAKIRQTQEQAAQETFQSQYLAAVDELEAKYPDTLDDNSEFSSLLDDLMTAARVRKDPGLADPRFILTKAEQVAKMLAPKPSGRPPTPPPAAPRPTGAAVAPAHAGVNRPTPDQIAEMINNADPDELLAAIS
ncbi:MAG: hypothetical protein LLG20_22625 [Acidobacteriales bacterium]|nr:hypothetical protein [Terriglobales bacterium]